MRACSAHYLCCLVIRRGSPLVLANTQKERAPNPSPPARAKNKIDRIERILRSRDARADIREHVTARSEERSSVANEARRGDVNARRGRPRARGRVIGALSSLLLRP